MGPGGILRGGGSGLSPPELGTERARPHAASGQPVPTPCRTSGLEYREVACPSLPCWGGFLPTLIPSRGRAWDLPWDAALPLLDLAVGRPQHPTQADLQKDPLLSRSHQTPRLAGRQPLAFHFVYYLKSRCLCKFFSFPILFSYRKLTQVAGTPHSPNSTPRAGNAFLGGPWRGQRGGGSWFLPGASTLRPAEAQILFKNR